MTNPLTSFRERYNITRGEAAVVLGLPYSLLAGIERGREKPTAKLLARLKELGENPETFKAEHAKHAAGLRREVESKMNR